MIKVDNHVYSKFSQDSRVEIKDIAKSAKEKGLDYVAITDRVDFSTQPVKEAIYRISNRNEKIDTFGQNNGIKIIKGIEIDEPHLYQEEQRMLLEATDTDFVLGSVHHVLGVPLKKMVTNPFVVDLYLRTLYQMVENADIDAVSHLDYLKKYIHDPNFNQEMIDKILKAMIERDILLEINSSGLKKTGDIYPSREIVSRYRELGGEAVIFGSGAHQINELAEGLDIIREGFADLELEEYYVLNRKQKHI